MCVCVRICFNHVYSQDNVRAKDELLHQKEAQLATSLLQQQQSGEETVQVVSCLVMCLCVTSSMIVCTDM